MKKDYKKMATEILELSGGVSNVSSFLNCMTRLRITPVNIDEVDVQKLEELPYVIKVQVVTGVVQVVLGPGTVDEVKKEFEVLCGVAGGSIDENLDDGKFTFAKVVSTLQAIVMPTIGVLGGAALINAIVVIAMMFGVSSEASILVFLTIAGSIVTNNLGVLFAFNTAKVFKGNPFIGVTLALLMYSPALEGISIFGFDLSPGMGGVIGIVLVVIMASYIERFLKEKIPPAIHLVIVPFLTLIIVFIPMLFVIVPLSDGLTLLITNLLEFALTSSPIVYVLATAVMAAVWILLVMTGLHISVVVILIPIALETGVMPLGASLGIPCASLIGATIGVIVKERKLNPEIKEIGYSGILVSMLGITEPLLYGIALPRVKPLIYSIIASFCGGLVLGIFQVELAYPSAMGFLAIFAVTEVPKMIFFILAWGVSMLVAFLLCMTIKPKEVV